MGSVNLVLEMITDVDKTLGPENLDERCWRAVFPSVFWTHYTLLCCGEVVTKLWERGFETPGNAEPGWQPALLLEIQDDGGEVPYTHRREWSFFVRWLCGQLKNPGLYHIQRRVFEDFEDIHVRSFLLPLGISFVTSSLWVLLCSKFFLFHSELVR
jgi:hypothetical protein